jgi:hypothetical protein
LSSSSPCRSSIDSSHPFSTATASTESSSAAATPSIATQSEWSSIFSRRGRDTPRQTRGVKAAEAAPEPLPPRQLTWHVERTDSRKLPVYSEYRNKNTAVRRQTLVRKFSGNQQDLAAELQSLVGPQWPVVCKTGKIVITGAQHGPKIVKWLRQMGF